MVASCVSSLATQTTVGTTQSLSTFASTVVSTLSAGVTTITSTLPCSAGPSANASCSAVVTTLTSTIPGTTTTITTQATQTIDVTTTQTTTFLNSSCSTFSAPPEVSTTTSMFVVTSDGQVSTRYVVSLVNPSTSTPASLQTNQVKANSSGGKNVGPIVGGIFGGLAGLALIVFAVLFFIRRRKRWDMIFDDDDGAWTPGPVVGKENPGDTPRPYHYGRVGRGRSDLEIDDRGQGQRMVLE